jgi:aspartyl-tRNA(Asn)/glutamyl-tRNA(Gln) amidotransferase subunit C
LPIANPAFDRLLGGLSVFIMNPSPEMNIEYVANLARLALTDAEKTRFSQQLGEILHYVEKLKQVDVTGVEPMAHASPVFNVWAADVPVDGLSVEKALQNAPSQRDNLIAIPKVME